MGCFGLLNKCNWFYQNVFKRHFLQISMENNNTNINTDKAAKTKMNPWMISTIVLAVVILALLLSGIGITGGVIGTGAVSEDVIGQKVVDFANDQTGGGVELVSVSEKYGLYEVVVSFQGQDIPLYVTQDGENLVQGVTPLNSEPATQPDQNTQAQQQAPQEVPKSDKPVVELFVMTHCPYGTQAEKGFIPAIKELGESIDAQIRFVHYFMHAPEESETPIQVCIREEQPDKFLPYLECFLEDGDSARCLAEVGVDADKVDECITGGRADVYYADDSTASQAAGVGGSPSLVINGQMISSGRSPSAMLQTICSAFNEAPEACNLVLDEASPSPGFGYSASGSDTQAQC